MFANTACSKLISLFFFRQHVINVLILHSALGGERGLRGRAAERRDSFCLPGTWFSKRLDSCECGGCLQVTNHHLALPRAFPADTAALHADANEFSLTAPRETGYPPHAPLTGDGAKTQMEEITFPRTRDPSAAEPAKSHSALAHLPTLTKQGPLSPCHRLKLAVSTPSMGRLQV